MPSFTFPDEDEDDVVKDVDEVVTKKDDVQNLDEPSTSPLQCFSCGSLFDPDNKCSKFDITDPSQVIQLGTRFALISC